MIVHREHPKKLIVVANKPKIKQSTGVRHPSSKQLEMKLKKIVSFNLAQKCGMLMYKLNKICAESLCWKLQISIEWNPESCANHTVLIAETDNIVKMLTVQKLIVYPVQSQTKPELTFKNHKSDSKHYWEANWGKGWEETETKAGTKL